MLELSDRYFKAAIIKMLQLAIMNMLETNEKNRKSKQRNRRYKKEWSGHFGTEKYNYKNNQTNKETNPNSVDRSNRGKNL